MSEPAIYIKPFTRPPGPPAGLSFPETPVSAFVTKTIVIYDSGPTTNGPLDGYWFDIVVETTSGDRFYHVPEMRKLKNGVLMLEGVYLHPSGGVLAISAMAPQKSGRDFVARADYSTRMHGAEIRFVLEADTEVTGSTSNATSIGENRTDEVQAESYTQQATFGVSGTAAPGGVGGGVSGGYTGSQSQTYTGPARTATDQSTYTQTVNQIAVKRLGLRQIARPPG